MKCSLKWASHTELKKLLVLYICILVSSAGAECSVLANLTSTKCEEPGYAVGQYPRVSTELEQVVRENIGEPEAEPVREKKKKKGFIFGFRFTGFNVQKTQLFSHPVQCCSSVFTLYLSSCLLKTRPVCSDWSARACLNQRR